MEPRDGCEALVEWGSGLMLVHPRVEGIAPDVVLVQAVLKLFIQGHSEGQPGFGEGPQEKKHQGGFSRWFQCQG